ncbi:MAG: zinc ribbon domain-containing protein [Candidatus Coatesbacteria bacterium]|nr:MAG: zinc ribbon domain-containing protein [Candidatus Coatesbacteria bacterium]HDM59536.1 zinc ribbon domain-containing protein [Bacillota bacterium]
MPTYEYECTQCGVHFESLQSMSDEPLQRCPKCGGRLRRLLGTGGGIIFKGNGFYTTDYRHLQASPSGAVCDRSRPCCGRSTPCDRSPRKGE